MFVMSAFAAISLMLAAIGIYGLMSYSVEQRTQKIGIRMALGAQQSDLRAMIMRQGLTLAVIGITGGIAGAFVAAKEISGFLFRVTAWDPFVFAIIPIVLLITAAIAVWWPANRATRVEPAVALRQS